MISAIGLRRLYRCTRILLLAGTLLLVVFPPAPVVAHGGDRLLQQMNAPAGPYRLTIWTAPSVLRTGQIHVEVAASDSRGLPVQTGLVYVAVIPSQETEPLQSVLALPVAQTQGRLREAELFVEHAGSYQFAVSIVDESGAGGQVRFDAEVIQVPRGIRYLIYILLGATLLAGVWILKEGSALWLGRKPAHPAPAVSLKSNKVSSNLKEVV